MVIMAAINCFTSSRSSCNSYGELLISEGVVGGITLLAYI